MPDLIAKRLFISKHFYFWYYAAGVFLIPYYNLFFKRVGLTGSQIGLTAALRPWTSQSICTVWGAFADKYTIHRFVLLFTFIASTITRCCIALPPVYSSFAILLTVVLVTEALQGPPNMLVDTATMATVRSDHDYGLQRLWGTVGWGLFSSLAGLIVQQYGVHATFVGYAIGSAICLVPTALVDFGPLYAKRRKSDTGEAAISSDTTPLLSEHTAETANTATVLTTAPADASAGMSSEPAAAENEGHEVTAVVLIEEEHPAPTSMRQVLRQPQTWAFFLLSVVMGFGIGTIEGFLFVYLDDLGAPTTLMGIDLAVTCMAEAPVFWLTSYLYKVISVNSALQIVLLAYVIRMSVYVSLPWWPAGRLWFILPVELLHGITFGVGWSAGTIQASRLAPNNMRATMQGIFQALFGGLGYGTGGLVGGVMYHNFGGQAVFACGIAVIVCGWLMYVVLQLVARGLGIGREGKE